MAKTQNDNKTFFQRFQEKTQSKGYKTFMAYIYGFGASIVMIGAYFKLTHIPGADVMLAIGLGTEALIFFLSAFEPQHLEYKWDNVFVELDEDWDGEAKTQFATSGKGGNVASGNIEEALLSQMFDKMNVNEDTFRRIGRGLEKLSENASQMSDLSNAMAATTSYAQTMDRATKSIADFANKYTETNEKLASSLASSLGKLDFSALDSTTIKKVANSMQALNSIYELQLQSAEQSAEASKKLSQTMNKYMENLSASADNAGQLNQQLNQLSSRLSALNNVYGGMLSAMNIKA